ncbi:MAG: antibiotic biosynthesis monooxygenase [Acidobacteria bacterium]|nr:antibiotic biosynthesis monooxygenase [Acidobacteriota bacterium]
MLIVHGEAQIGPAIRERWLETTRETVPTTRAEPGNLMYLYAADLFEPSSFHVFQVWEDQASMDAHIADPFHRQRINELDAMGGRWEHVTHYDVSAVRHKR